MNVLFALRVLKFLCLFLLKDVHLFTFYFVRFDLQTRPKKAMKMLNRPLTKKSLKRWGLFSKSIPDIVWGHIWRHCLLTHQIVFSSCPPLLLLCPPKSLPELVDWSYTHHSNQAKFCSLIGLTLVGQEHLPTTSWYLICPPAFWWANKEFGGQIRAEKKWWVRIRKQIWSKIFIYQFFSEIRIFVHAESMTEQRDSCSKTSKLLWAMELHWNRARARNFPS